MVEILLCRRYYTFNDRHTTQIDTIEAEFKTQGLVLCQKGMITNYITINKRGQKILFEELRKRFKR